MQILTIAGTLGRDAEHKTTQAGQELCTFPVAVNTGYGDRKVTTWFDVTSWGKGSEGLARILRKGSKVALSGELSTREHNGKTYLQVRANGVTIQSTPDGGQCRNPAHEPHPGAHGGRTTADDDLDDSIPF